MKYKILWLIVILVILVALLVSKKAIAPQTVEASSNSVAVTDSLKVVSSLEKPQQDWTKSKVESLVRSEFSDIPIMVSIARCESQFRQYENGEVLKGVVNPLDKGLFQINEKYHLEASKRLGIDIYTIEGNITYARVLYKQSGTEPWNASKFCWSI